jgi:hypothetical protein
VNLYEKYKGRVQFVIIDLDRAHPSEQRPLIETYYRGYIPHVVVLDGAGKAVYNEAGEVGEEKISGVLDRLLNKKSP